MNESVENWTKRKRENSVKLTYGRKRDRDRMNLKVEKDPFEEWRARRKQAITSSSFIECYDEVLLYPIKFLNSIRARNQIAHNSSCI